MWVQDANSPLWIPPMKFLRSDLFRSFGIGFGIVAVTLLVTRFDGAEGLVAILS